MIAVDSETEGMVRRLARLRGETAEQAIGAAVREALARSEHAKTVPLTVEQEALVDRSMEIVASVPPFDVDPGDSAGFLYDENGLPR